MDRVENHNWNDEGLAGWKKERGCGYDWDTSLELGASRSNQV